MLSFSLTGIIFSTLKDFFRSNNIFYLCFMNTQKEMKGFKTTRLLGKNPEFILKMEWKAIMVMKKAEAGQMIPWKY